MRRLGGFLGFFLCSYAAGQIGALPPAFSFDPTKGVIDGKTAFSLWPSTSGASASDANGKPGDPAGFEAHIALKDDPEAEVVHPAGQWFMPPVYGVFMVWLESPTQYLMSPSPTPLHYQGSPFNGRGLALVGRFGPAGRVRLAAPVCAGSCSLGLIHATSHVLPGGGIRPEMRRVMAEGTAVEHGALMPAGPVAATLYDKRLKEYRAIEVPVAVAPRQTVLLHPKPPKPGQSDLLVVLTRPDLLHKAEDEDVAPRLLLASGKSVSPAFVVSGPRLLYAIWTGVAAGKATLTVQSKTVRLPPAEIVLRSGHVESLEASLATLPKLGLRLDLPEELRQGSLHISVSDAAGPGGEITREVAAETEHVDFEHVRDARLRVSVVAGPWELEEVADLSDGRDREVTVGAQLLAVEGTVYYGRDPRPAEVSFQTNHLEDKVTVKADSQGHYHVLLARPMTYLIMVQFPDRGRPSIIPLNIVQSGRQDLRVPANDFRIRVVRSDTGAPIPRARVDLLNTGSDQITDGQSIETGKDGIARVQPLRAGKVEIDVKARRFAPGETVKEKVPDEELSREITVPLTPLEGDNAVAVLLPSGLPAFGAELWIQPDPAAPPLILRSDPAGKVSLPDNAANMPILVRAPGAASGFVSWDGETDSIQLGPAGPALTLAARKENGDPGAWARMEVWIDGVRWAGPLLQWAFSAQPSVDARGLVTLQGLPPKPVEVLFWSPEPGTAALAKSGAFDSRRTTVDFPWPPVVTATMVE